MHHVSTNNYFIQWISLQLTICTCSIFASILSTYTCTGLQKVFTKKKKSHSRKSSRTCEPRSVEWLMKVVLVSMCNERFNTVACPQFLMVLSIKIKTLCGAGVGTSLPQSYSPIPYFKYQIFKTLSIHCRLIITSQSSSLSVLFASFTFNSKVNV